MNYAARQMESAQPKILYLSYDGMTDSLGQSQVLPYLFGLTKKGANIHLISFEKKEFAKDIPYIQALCQKNGIVWHPQYYTKKPPLISTLKDLRRMKKIALSLHREIHFEIIHCRSYISAIIGRYFQLNKNVKYVFDMRGFWADERIEGKIWNIRRPLFKMVYQFFKKKELEFFNTADTIVSLTMNGKQTISSWKNISNSVPIEVIPCCVDLDLFNPEKINSEKAAEKRKELGITENDFVLGYVGSIGTWYMLPEMLDFYAVLRQQKDQCKFLFVSRESREEIVNLAQKRGIPEQEIIVINVMHEQVPLYISLFDFSIFFIRPTFSKRASSPTKQGELMAMGIPIICNAGIGDTDTIINDAHAGIVIKNCNIENYKAHHLNPLDYNATQIRKGAEKWYSLENGVEKYATIYQSLLSDG